MRLDYKTLVKAPHLTLLATSDPCPKIEPKVAKKVKTIL